MKSKPPPDPNLKKEKYGTERDNGCYNKNRKDRQMIHGIMLWLLITSFVLICTVIYLLEKLEDRMNRLKSFFSKETNRINDKTCGCDNCDVKPTGPPKQKGDMMGKLDPIDKFCIGLFLFGIVCIVIGASM